jgi:hypothetical protein
MSAQIGLIRLSPFMALLRRLTNPTLFSLLLAFYRCVQFNFGKRFLHGITFHGNIAMLVGEQANATLDKRKTFFYHFVFEIRAILFFFASPPYLHLQSTTQAHGIKAAMMKTECCFNNGRRKSSVSFDLAGLPPPLLFYCFCARSLHASGYVFNRLPIPHWDGTYLFQATMTHLLLLLEEHIVKSLDTTSKGGLQSSTIL